MLSTLTLKEAGHFLKVKDMRSVKKWCSMKGVKIFTDEETRKKYLIRTEFENARMEKLIQYFKSRYPDHWQEAIRAHMDIFQLNEFKEKYKHGISCSSRNRNTVNY